MNNLLNIKSFLKFLSRNKGYTAIDVFGLSVSLMFVILIAVYVERELNIDKQQANYDRIVAIGNEEFLESGVPVSYWLEERYPEIEKVCPVITDQGKSKQIFYGDKKLTADLVYADSTFFGLFSFKILDGDRDRLLEDPYSAVVSESFARKVFGNDDPIGKSLRISDSTSVMVTGVMEDINRSVIPNADLLVRIERVTEFNQSLSKTNPGNAGSCVSFLLLKPGMDLKGRTDEIQSFFKERYWIYRYDFVKEARVVPLSDIYFGNTASHSLNQGDKRFSLVLMSVGILILIFAIINYINLTVAQAGQRAKEMATRRLLGSSRVELFLRLMLEATFLTVVSFAIGLMFAKAALPYANDLLQVRLTFDVLATPLWIGVILLFFFNGYAALFQICDDVFKAFVFFADLFFRGIDDLIGQTDRRGTRDVPPADEDGVQQGLHHVPECDHDRHDRRLADDVSPDRPSDPRAVGLQHDEHNRIV